MELGKGILLCWANRRFVIHLTWNTTNALKMSSYASIRDGAFIAAHAAFPKVYYLNTFSTAAPDKRCLVLHWKAWTVLSGLQVEYQTMAGIQTSCCKHWVTKLCYTSRSRQCRAAFSVVDECKNRHVKHVCFFFLASEWSNKIRNIFEWREERKVLG